jgi:hypothetical protein
MAEAMDIEVLKGFLRLGALIGGCGVVMAFMQPPGSAEFVLSVCSALMGGTVIGGVFLLSRWANRRVR